MKVIPAICISVFALGCAAGVLAKGDDLPVVKPKVKTVAAFKNALGFVYKCGETKLQNGWAQMNEIPAAALGTLWIGTTSPRERVEEVLSTKATTKSEVDAASYSDLLDSNVGRKLTMLCSLTASGEPETITGTVLSKTSGQFVLVKTDDGRTVAVSKDSIRMITLDADSSVKHTLETESNIAKIRVGGNLPSAEITVAYLEKGITWSPSYLINIQNDKLASITLQAVLANDMEDLEDVDVSFVVGYPNFMFADTLSPFLLQQSVASFTNALSANRPASAGYLSNGFLSNTMTQSVMYNTADYDQWRPELSYSAGKPMAGESSEDLFFYHQPHVTMKKGDRAMYTVFTSKVPYEHVYLWDVPDSMNINDWGGRISNNDRGNSDKEQVWHALKIDNDTSQPWTTAPAFVVNGSNPLAQATMDYTPSGGRNTVKLTVATDIRGEQSQTEVSREPKRIRNNDYDEVTVDGMLTISNFKKDPVKLIIKKAIVGDVLQSGSGNVVKQAKKLTAVNVQSQITWEFTLAPGEEKKLDYRYKVLVD